MLSQNPQFTIHNIRFVLCSPGNGQWTFMAFNEKKKQQRNILYRSLFHIYRSFALFTIVFTVSRFLYLNEGKDYSTVHSFLISELRSPDSISLVFSSMPYNWRQQINIDLIEVIDFLFILPTKIQEMKSSFRRDWKALTSMFEEFRLVFLISSLPFGWVCTAAELEELKKYCSSNRPAENESIAKCLISWFTYFSLTQRRKKLISNRGKFIVRRNIKGYISIKDNYFDEIVNIIKYKIICFCLNAHCTLNKFLSFTCRAPFRSNNKMKWVENEKSDDC